MDKFMLQYDVLYGAASFLILLMALKLDIKVQWDRSLDNAAVAVIVVGFVFLFGWRDIDIGADTWNYVLIFKKIRSWESFSTLIAEVKGDLLFYMFTYTCASVTDSSRFYLTLVAILYLVPVTLFCYKVAPSRRSLLLLAFISFFFFQSMGINVIRNGVSLAFMLYSLVLNKREERLRKIFCIVIACSFHLSAMLLLLCSLFTRYTKKSAIYYAILLLASTLSMAGYGINNIPFVSDLLAFDRISRYAEESPGKYTIGFRSEFFAFNIGFIFFSEFFRLRLQDLFYTKISRIFMLLSAFFFLCFNLSYSDRFGLLSWVFIPLILYYPFTTYRITRRLQHVLLMLMLFGFRLFSVTYFSK
jgi:hypothetical protein